MEGGDPARRRRRKAAREAASSGAVGTETEEERVGTVGQMLEATERSLERVVALLTALLGLGPLPSSSDPATSGSAGHPDDDEVDDVGATGLRERLFGLDSLGGGAAPTFGAVNA